MLPSIGMPSVVRRIEKRRRVFILIEFIQGNAQWLVLGAVFLLMMKMHGSGRGMGLVEAWVAAAAISTSRGSRSGSRISSREAYPIPQRKERARG